MEFPSTEMHEHVALIFYLSGTNATLDRCFFFVLFCRKKSFLFSALYAAFIFGGRHLMNKRAKFELRKPLVLWSLSLAVFRQASLHTHCFRQQSLKRVLFSSDATVVLVRQQAQPEMEFFLFCCSGLCPDPFLTIEMVPFGLLDHTALERREINNVLEE